MAILKDLACDGNNGWNVGLGCLVSLTFHCCGLHVRYVCLSAAELRNTCSLGGTIWAKECSSQKVCSRVVLTSDLQRGLHWSGAHIGSDE